ncbi:HlyD family efflux transporter periplasmic adaptor subunit [Roseomonas sp. CCTCC AB2023176]|uniref:HlyD family efflux transporter periplasmic adaptor subunit n=1 Tax=Roseomonas sp. CCTCC AB2023176 TaxID=3342640 RepID=UPI0035E29A64
MRDQPGLVTALTPDMAAPAAEPRPPLPDPRPAPAVATSTPNRGRLLRVAVSLGLLALIGYFVQDRFFSTEADGAFLDGAPIAVRTPISGTVSLAPALSVGNVIPADTRFGTVVNPRADTSRLSDLTLALSSAEASLTALTRRIAYVEGEIAASEHNLGAFRDARTETLTARVREIDESVSAAGARLAEATRGLRRAEALSAGGVATVAALEAARRAEAVAHAELDGARNRRAATDAELRAARAGVNVADAATDRSASQQQRDRLRDQLEDLAAQQIEREAQVAALRPLIATETERTARMGEAALQLHAPGRLLRLVAQAGEHVQPGQEIAILADCANPEATATVSPAVFRRLQVGQTARFKAAQDDAWRNGTVSALRAEPGATSNSARRLEVVVSFPAEVGSTRACESGRLGRLAF